MAKRGKKNPQIETLNPFEQYGDRHHHPSRVILFDNDPRNDVWLEALEAFDHGDKSELVALLKSGYPIPPAIVPHIGSLIERVPSCRDGSRPPAGSCKVALCRIRRFEHGTVPFLRDHPHRHRSAPQLTGGSSVSRAMRGSKRKLPGQMCQPLWWDGSEQVPELLRPAGDQLLRTRACRGAAVVAVRHPLS
jgi:hypothetical protein